MEAVFVPDLSVEYRWMSLCCIAGLAGVALAVFSFRQNTFRLRAVGQLLGPLLALAGLAGGGLIVADMAMTPTVVVADDYLLLGNDSIPQAEVKSAFLKSVNETNRINQSDQRDVAIVTFADDRVKVFSDKQYEVGELVRAVREMLGE